MASAVIQAFLQPPNVDGAGRLTLDTLNVKYRSLHDVEQQPDLEGTVDQARQQSEELKAKVLQLSQSQAEVDALIRKSRADAHEALQTAQELSLLRHSLADELSHLSQQLVSSMGEGGSAPTLLEDLETLHRNLKELESVKGYVQVVEHALNLSELAVEQVRSSRPLSSVSQYEALQEFVHLVRAKCTRVEEVASHQKLHILDFLESVRQRTWSDMKSALSSMLIAATEKFNWPTPVEYASVSSEDRRTFENAFLNLLKLQTIGNKLHAMQENESESNMFPIQALVRPIALRFKYHFDGTRQTNRLDKPEWYFTHILNVSHEHRPFMERVVQGLLARTEYKHIDAWREFTLCLLPLPSRKLKKTIPTLLSHPPILAHTIYQALAFDSALKEEGFDIAGTITDTASEPAKHEQKPKWEGLSEVILGHKEWFEAWMEAERKFAMDQYMEIISAADAWQIADDIPNDSDGTTLDHELRTTNSARRVKALIEQVTDRYSPLPQFGQRTKFLIAVQLPLLESYHSRISSSLDAFETLSSTFMRAVPGALGTVTGDGSGRSNDPKRLTSGVEGIQRLCKAFISARYIAAAMENWGEDLFFLELWAEINHKASLRSRAQAAQSLPDPKSHENEAIEGTIFEELITQYSDLAARAEEMVVQSICSEVETSLRQHFISGGPTQATPHVNPEDDIALPQTLLGPIASLSSQLSFLYSTLPDTTATSLYRKVASRLASHIMQREILYRGRGRISPQEGRNITAESELWAETCRIAMGRGERTRTEAPWRQLLQASRLLGLDGVMWQKAVDTTLGVSSDHDWEEVMLELVGYSELPREEVSQILRTRTDCER
ncbi:RINT-1 family protein [Obba rivulosa]|uniref:RINT-1 family protein n=1 Tax=Obba rivulosa TaxID=1052685 RepID=A0A8E2AV33_9APHY|nr:RINT-1 family protein [Obba rivulosa]